MATLYNLLSIVIVGYITQALFIPEYYGYLSGCIFADLILLLLHNLEGKKYVLTTYRLISLVFWFFWQVIFFIFQSVFIRKKRLCNSISIEFPNDITPNFLIFKYFIKVAGIEVVLQKNNILEVEGIIYGSMTDSQWEMYTRAQVVRVYKLIS